MSEIPEPEQPTPKAPPAPPAQPLPPPEAPTVSFPLIPIVIAIGLTIGCGIALSIASKIIYIYILYNALIGGAIGWALAKAPKNNRYTNAGMLLVLTLILSLAAYFVYHYVNYLVFPEFAGVQAGAPDPGFFQFLLIEAANEWFIFGLQLGLVGTLIVWAIEAAITFFVAWAKVQSAIHMCKVESVPDPVRDYVLQLLADEHDQATVERELAKHGWNTPEDQARALESAHALITLMAEAQKNKQG
jgi:hypothetical protein